MKHFSKIKGLNIFQTDVTKVTTNSTISNKLKININYTYLQLVKIKFILKVFKYFLKVFVNVFQYFLGRFFKYGI